MWKTIIASNISSAITARVTEATLLYMQTCTTNEKQQQPDNVRASSVTRNRYDYQLRNAFECDVPPLKRPRTTDRPLTDCCVRANRSADTQKVAAAVVLGPDIPRTFFTSDIPHWLPLLQRYNLLTILL